MYAIYYSIEQEEEEEEKANVKLIHTLVGRKHTSLLAD